MKRPATFVSPFSKRQGKNPKEKKIKMEGIVEELRGRMFGNQSVDSQTDERERDEKEMPADVDTRRPT